jgi:hypothetical protein
MQRNNMSYSQQYSGSSNSQNKIDWIKLSSNQKAIELKENKNSLTIVLLKNDLK